MTENTAPLTVELLRDIEMREAHVGTDECPNVIHITQRERKLILAAARRGIESGWQPIESVPDDVKSLGLRIWVSNGAVKDEVYWKSGHWYIRGSEVCRFYGAVYWMKFKSPPLPQPPTDTEREEALSELQRLGQEFDAAPAPTEVEDDPEADKTLLSSRLKSAAPSPVEDVEGLTIKKINLRNVAARERKHGRTNLAAMIEEAVTEIQKLVGERDEAKIAEGVMRAAMLTANGDRVSAMQNCEEAWAAEADLKERVAVLEGGLRRIADSEGLGPHRMSDIEMRECARAALNGEGESR